jgi:SAM-dependent methyltransferase
LSWKSKLNLLRRHSSLLGDVVCGTSWQEIKDIADSLDEREIYSFISDLKTQSLAYDNSIGSSKTTALKLNKLCLLDDFENSELRQTLSEINKLDPNGLIHRKDWEWAMGIIALKRLGKLASNNTAIGIGCGTEVVPFYLANKLKHVYATDLYEGSGWQAAAPPDFVNNPKKYAPFPYREDALTVQRMNGTKLEFLSDSFDIAFSFSSIEHFAGKNHSGALKSLKEMERVLKPGGIAVVATEYIINDKNHYEFFNKRTLFADLIDRLELLELVEPIDFRITAKTLDTVLDFFTIDMNWNRLDHKFKKKHPLILLRARNILFTSIMLVFSKKPYLR